MTMATKFGGFTSATVIRLLVSTIKLPSESNAMTLRLGKAAVSPSAKGIQSHMLQPKQFRIEMPKYQNPKLRSEPSSFGAFSFGSFDIVSSFGSRASNFALLSALRVSVVNQETLHSIIIQPPLCNQDGGAPRP